MILLRNIQPTQAYLCEESIEKLMCANPNDFFKDKRNPIEVYRARGNEFPYVLKEGHHRLLICHRKGIGEIPVTPIGDAPLNYISQALKTRRQGFRTVADLEGHFLPAFLCALLAEF